MQISVRLWDGHHMSYPDTWTVHGIDGSVSYISEGEKNTPCPFFMAFTGAYACGNERLYEYDIVSWMGQYYIVVYDEEILGYNLENELISLPLEKNMQDFKLEGNAIENPEFISLLNCDRLKAVFDLIKAQIPPEEDYTADRIKLCSPDEVSCSESELLLFYSPYEDYETPSPSYHVDDIPDDYFDDLLDYRTESVLEPEPVTPQYVEIYCDAYFDNQSRKAAYSYIVKWGKEEIADTASLKHCANANSAKVQALSQALKTIIKPCDVKIYTKSDYVTKPISNGWIQKWRDNSWMVGGTYKKVSDGKYFKNILMYMEKCNIQTVFEMSDAEKETVNCCFKKAQQFVKENK